MARQQESRVSLSDGVPIGATCGESEGTEPRSTTVSTARDPTIRLDLHSAPHSGCLGPAIGKEPGMGMKRRRVRLCAVVQTMVPAVVLALVRVRVRVREEVLEVARPVLFLSWVLSRSTVLRYLDDGGGDVATLNGRRPPKKKKERVAGAGERSPSFYTMNRTYGFWPR